MEFNIELQTVLMQIKDAEDLKELEYLRETHEKKYWWSSIFVCGLFYGLNGKAGKMILSWVISCLTLGIYYLYLIYRSYEDQKDFNGAMELAILKRKKQLEE